MAWLRKGRRKAKTTSATRMRWRRKFICPCFYLPTFLLAYVKHDAEARLAAQHVLISFGRAIEREGFVHGSDTGENAEVERILGVDGRAGVKALDGLIEENHLQRVHFQ